MASVPLHVGGSQGHHVTRTAHDSIPLGSDNSVATLLGGGKTGGISSLEARDKHTHCSTVSCLALLHPGLHAKLHKEAYS